MGSTVVTSLEVPAYDDIELTEAIVAERQNGINAQYFSDYSPEWITRITEYLENQGNPEIIADSQIPDAFKEKFINLYKTQNTNNIQHLIIKGIRSSNLLFCPACGEDGNPETIDHYLPKDVFPEYAVLTKNLFPMCQKCQTIKGKNVLDAGGNKQYIHPYYDSITVPVLYLTIAPPYCSPYEFRLFVKDDIEEPLQSLIKRHLNGLKIDNRFEKFCNEKYIHLLKLASASRSGPIRIQTHLPSFLFLEEQKAINSWGAIFYRSVIDNAELITYLENGQLPDNL